MRLEKADRFSGHQLNFFAGLGQRVELVQDGPRHEEDQPVSQLRQLFSLRQLRDEDVGVHHDVKRVGTDRTATKINYFNV